MNQRTVAKTAGIIGLLMMASLLGTACSQRLSPAASNCPAPVDHTNVCQRLRVIVCGVDYLWIGLSPNSQLPCITLPVSIGGSSAKRFSLLLCLILRRSLDSRLVFGLLILHIVRKRCKSPGESPYPLQGLNPVAQRFNATTLSRWLCKTGMLTLLPR